MKKIVALVLAMVMVMGLATVASAAQLGADTLDAAKADAGWNYNVEVDDAEDAKDETFATYEIEAVAKKDLGDVFPSWAAATLTDVEKGDDFDVEGTFIKVANADAADLVMIDGKTVTYFMDVTGVEAAWDAKAEKVTLPAQPVDAADFKCNTLYSTLVGVPATVYFVNETLYVADYAAATDVFNVGGVAVFVREAVAGDYYYNEHDYEVEYKGDHDVENVTKVYCQNCKAEFKFVAGPETVAIATFGADNYQYEQGLWMELVVPANWPSASASAGAADGETVESAKTFDAGIAMYVGMSVMAAAGSAVVLKKKD